MKNENQNLERSLSEDLCYIIFGGRMHKVNAKKIVEKGLNLIGKLEIKFFF